MNIQKLMQQAQEMQQKLVREQGQLTVETSVGGGMVAVKMNGHKQLLEITIDPEVVDPDDPSMLGDLVMAAVNEGCRIVDERLQERLGGLARGIPGLF